MERYLDPKNDLLFKKIFGEHKDLLISFLNAMLPLGAEREIREIEYLSPEMVPVNTLIGKFSAVDVRCIDRHNRSFVVEMQNDWTKSFCKRLLLNGAKAIVNQMNKKLLDDPAVDYRALEPVYVVAVVNDEFTDKTKKQWYHHLRLTDPKNPNFFISGLDYILLELPKFKKGTRRSSDNKIAVLWVRFFREINHLTEDLPKALKNNELIRKALDICKESALTYNERQIYDSYLDKMMGDNTVKNMERELDENAQTIAEQGQTITEQGQTITEQGQTIEKNAKALADANQDLADANQTITEQNQTIEKKDQALAVKDAEIEALRKQLGL